VRRWFVALAFAASLLPACGGSQGAESSELTVAAAASLTDAFTDIGRTFEEENPGASVRFTFGPSDGLATQIIEGAPVDVFASASRSWIKVVRRGGPGLGPVTDFARNNLAIIVPVDNPAEVNGLVDLTRTGMRLVIAAEGVPAGDYAREMFANAGIRDAALANVVSNEEDVKGVVTKVLSGDADAGIAYATDVTADVADDIALIPIPDEVNVIAIYPIAVVREANESELANSFVDYVLGEGQRILAGYGFLPAG
jgi:molybdate transport system substrate-binding protein